MMWFMRRGAMLTWVVVNIAVVASAAADDDSAVGNMPPPFSRSSEKVHRITCQAFEAENKAALKLANGKATSDAVQETGPFVDLQMPGSEEELQTNRKVVLQAAKQQFRSLRLDFVTPEIRGDRQVVLEAVKHDWRALSYASKALQNDREIAWEAIRQDGRAFDYTDFYDNEEMMLAAAKIQANSLVYASEAIKNNREIVLEAVRQNGLALSLASPKLCADREIVLLAVKGAGGVLRYASEELQDDRSIVLEAVRQDGLALEFASAKQQADQAIVLEAIRKNASALCFASKELRGNRDIVLEAVQQQDVLVCASAALKDDRQIVLEAVRHNGHALESAPKFQDDEEIVREAIKKDGCALAYASEGLRGSRPIVLDAVSQCGGVLEFASPKLQGDHQVVLQAVKSNGAALRNASKELQADKEVVLEAVRQNGRALAWAAQELKGDEEVVFEAVRQYGEAFEWASPELHGNRRIVLEAEKNDAFACYDAPKASEELQKDPDFFIEVLKVQVVRHRRHVDSVDCFYMADIDNEELVLRALNQTTNAAYITTSLKVRSLAISMAETYSECFALTRCSNNASVNMLHDRGVVLALARNKFCYLPYPALKEEFRCDEEIATLAVKKDGSFLEDTCDDLRHKLGANRSLMISAVQDDADALRFAFPNLQGDWELVAIAASQGKARQYCNASTQFLGSKTHVLQALQSDGMLLQCASAKFQDNKQLVMAAVNQTGCALKFSSKRLRDDHEIVQQALQGNGLALAYASQGLQCKASVQLQALSQPGWSWLLSKKTITNSSPSHEECVDFWKATKNDTSRRRNEYDPTLEIGIGKGCLATVMPVLSGHPLSCTRASSHPHHLSTKFIAMYAAAGGLLLLLLTYVTNRAGAKQTPRNSSREAAEDTADLEQVLMNQSMLSPPRSPTQTSRSSAEARSLG